MPLESARVFKWRPSTRVESSSSNELGQTRMRSAPQRRRGIGLFVDGAATRRWPIGSRSMRPSSGCCAKPKRFPRSIATSDDTRSPTLPPQKKGATDVVRCREPVPPLHLHCSSLSVQSASAYLSVSSRFRKLQDELFIGHVRKQSI